MNGVYRLADLHPPHQLDRNLRLGVIGQPVIHSRSPQMMNAALAHCGMPLRYARFEIAPEELETALRSMAASEFVGVNLTIPHKRAAAILVDELDDFARAVGAVNCVRFEGPRPIGCNSDGPGFARAIHEEFGAQLRDLRVLVLGAGGGAGRAIAHQCAREACPSLVLANRDFGKARDLARDLSARAIRWNDAEFEAEIANVDLLVNATPIGMRETDARLISPTMLRRDFFVYDAIYDPPQTRLLVDAAQAGARVANGLSMLLHQGALSFEHWFGRAAPLEEMRAALA